MADASNVQVRTVEVAVQASAEKATSTLEKLATQLTSLGGIIDTVVEKAGGLATIGKVDTSNVKDVLAAAKDLGKSFTDLEKKKPRVNVKTENIEKANKILDEMFEKARGKTNIDIGRSKSDVEKNLSLWENKLAELYKRFDEIGQKGGKAFEGKEFRSVAEQIVNVTNVLEQANEALADWDGYINSLPPLNVADFEPGSEGQQNVIDYSNAAQEAQEATQRIGEMGSQSNETSFALDRFGEAIAKTFNNAKWLASLFGGTLKTAFNVAKSAINGVHNAIRKLASAFKSALGAVKSFAKGLAHPISTLKSAFGMGQKSGGGILGSLLRGRSLGQFVGLIVLRRAITSALRAIVSGIKEGFENIRQYSSAINSEMNSIQNSLLYVKNAWAAAFAPIVSVVRPYINYLLDAIAAALNAIGRLVAMLTGKGFAVQAVKLSDAMYEAGKAGESAAGGTGKAAKAAEEYKKTIMGFDQLHVLNAQDSSSGSGGGGGGGGGGSSSGINVNDMFTTVSLAGALKDAIDAEDWTEVGRLMAEKVNEAFSKIDEAISWENIGDKITKKVNAITETLNSLQYNINWEQIGRTFGSGINTLVNTWNLFFDGFDFVSLGKNLATGINGLFNRVDWNALGRAVTQKFKALWETIYGFVTKLDWAKIGTSIGEFINGAMKNINLGTVGSSIAETLNGIATSLNNFTSTVDWDAFSDEISSFFTNFFTKFRAADFLDSLSAFARSLVTGLTVALSNPNTLAAFQDFARQVGTKLASLDWAKYLVELAGAILLGLGTALDGLLQGFMEGLLIKAGLTPEQAHSAFTQHQELQNYAMTGDPNMLPQGETKIGVTAQYTKSEDKLPPEQKKIRNTTAVETKTQDKIPANQKNINNSTAVINNQKDDLKQDQKRLPNFRADLNLFHDGIEPANKKLNNYNALLTGNTDKIPGKSKEINNYKANVTSATLNVGSKTLDIGGRIVSVVKKPGLNPTIDVTANIRNTASNGWKLVPQANGGVFSGGSWKPITRYASGGTPQSAELFMAREAGPELVGRIGSKTAVMNNNQIVSSVAAGVRQAVAEGMSIANRGGGSSAPYEIHVTVKTQDDEVLARAVERGNAKRKYRLSTAMA